jgi:hypothetical protein
VLKLLAVEIIHLLVDTLYTPLLVMGHSVLIQQIMQSINLYLSPM